MPTSTLRAQDSHGEYQCRSSRILEWIKLQAATGLQPQEALPSPHQPSVEATSGLRSRIEMVGSGASQSFLPGKRFAVDDVFFGDETFAKDQGLNIDVEGDVFMGDAGLKVTSPPFGFHERTSFPGV